jgi:hypothetical protein
MMNKRNFLFSSYAHKPKNIILNLGGGFAGLGRKAKEHLALKFQEISWNQHAR